ECGSQTVEVDRLRADEWVTDVELDLCMAVECQAPEIDPLEELPIVESSDRSGHRPDPIRTQWLSPDIEEVPQRVRLRVWRFDVDQSIICMRVQAIKTCAATNKARSVCHGFLNADRTRNLTWSSIDKDRQVGMDVN